VYGQPNEMGMHIRDLPAIQDIPLECIPFEKVHLADINIAYKRFGSGEPILLVSGASVGIDSWDPSTLTSLCSNYTVIVFDSRGVGNSTTTGSKPYTIERLANDAAGLLDALGIRKADVLVLSLGSFIAQQLQLQIQKSLRGMYLSLHRVWSRQSS